VAIAAAALTAKVAHDLRARLAEHVPDRAVAIMEDLAALGQGWPVAVVESRRLRPLTIT